MTIRGQIHLIGKFNTIQDFLASRPVVHQVELKGSITFKDVSFAYESRPNVNVLDKFNLEVPAGKTIALVGSSGCGKSTTISLLQQFYKPTSGQILLDGHDMATTDIEHLRRQMALVSQEPQLFSTTIAENIARGDCTRIISQAEIERAATAANAKEFIEHNEQGYNTHVGEKGTQLSGGQRQRIAIAR